MGAPPRPRPRCYPGRCRGRSLGRRAPVMGPGRVDERCWLRAGGVGPGHGSADPGRGAREHATEHPAAAKGGGVAQAWPRGSGCRQDADARGPPRGALPIAVRPLFRAMDTPCSGLLPLSWGCSSAYGGASRWPRRLTVLTIAVEAPNTVIHVPWVARAVQRRRPRVAAGWALVAAGSVARLRAPSRPGRPRAVRPGRPAPGRVSCMSELVMITVC